MDNNSHRAERPTKVPIRCCCNPALLLGFVELEVSLVSGRTYVFSTTDGTRIELELGRVFDHLTRQMRYALKSNDTPIEKLRTISGFVEVSKPVRIGEENGAHNYSEG